MSGGRLNRWTRFQDAATLIKPAGSDGLKAWTLVELDKLVPLHMLSREA